MNLGFLLTSRHLLWILLAPPLMAFAQCDKEVYRNLLNEFCLQQFQLNMESLGMNLWCDWKATEEAVEGDGNIGLPSLWSIHALMKLNVRRGQRKRSYLPDPQRVREWTTAGHTRLRGGGLLEILWEQK
ncbi:receptor activity-modifying protein 1 isoform 3-T3 [Anomaloglossus baeobatrachus]|uniref:receptor activity-modifying protein 1 isoform X3 n=1 Tax=Anomaloglossus baeobatrachus TaxID=238106 RepID=UPI003F509435